MFEVLLIFRVCAPTTTGSRMRGHKRSDKNWRESAITKEAGGMWKFSDLRVSLRPRIHQVHLSSPLPKFSHENHSRNNHSSFCFPTSQIINELLKVHMRSAGTQGHRPQRGNQVLSAPGWGSSEPAALLYSDETVPSAPQSCKALLNYYSHLRFCLILATKIGYILSHVQSDKLKSQFLSNIFRN